MSRYVSPPIGTEHALHCPRGVTQDFQKVSELSGSIAARAAEFRSMATRLGELVAAFHR